MGAGLEAPLRREPVIEFWRERDWDWGMESLRGMLPRVRSAVEEGRLPAMPPTVLMLPAVPVVMLRVLVLEEERWCRRSEGAG
jgi:hypothetical protein